MLIEIALSNISFEAWILLFFQKTLVKYVNYFDLCKRSKLKGYIINNYKKGNRHPFSDNDVTVISWLSIRFSE